MQSPSLQQVHFPNRAEATNAPACACHPQTALISILISHLQSSPGQENQQPRKQDARAGDVNPAADRQDVTLEKIKAARGLARELRGGRGKWQAGLCHTQHFFKTVSAEALNQLRMSRAPLLPAALASSPLHAGQGWEAAAASAPRSAGVCHPQIAEHQSYQHRRTPSAHLKPIAQIGRGVRGRRGAKPRATRSTSCRKQQMKSLPHFLRPALLSRGRTWAVAAAPPAQMSRGCRNWASTAHQHLTPFLFPPVPPPEGTAINQQRDGQDLPHRPAVRHPPSHRQLLGWLQQHQHEKENKWLTFFSRLHFLFSPARAFVHLQRSWGGGRKGERSVGTGAERARRAPRGAAEGSSG